MFPRPTLHKFSTSQNKLTNCWSHFNRPLGERAFRMDRPEGTANSRRKPTLNRQLSIRRSLFRKKRTCCATASWLNLLIGVPIVLSSTAAYTDEIETGARHEAQNDSAKLTLIGRHYGNRAAPGGFRSLGALSRERSPPFPKRQRQSGFATRLTHSSWKSWRRPDSNRHPRPTAPRCCAGSASI